MRQWLLGYGFETFHPVLPVRYVLRGRVTVVEEPLFPKYLLVRFDVESDQWARINNGPGAVRVIAEHVVRCEDGAVVDDRWWPVPTDDRVIDRLKVAYDEGTLISMAEAMNLVVREGEEARVIDGPFAGHLGMCEWSDAERVGLLVSIFGRQVPVEVKASQVEVAA